MNVSIEQKSHLGDSIFLLNLMYNHNESFVVSGPSHINSLLSLFAYNNIIYDSTTTGRTATIESLIQNWIPQFDWHKTDLSYIKKLKMPATRISTSTHDFACFQFDSRSFNDDFKKQFTVQECKTCLRRFSRSNHVVGVGGEDTVPYLNHTFKTGNLESVFSVMMSSSQFIGIDSGMSHLAGTAQIDSDVIIQDSRPNQINRVMLFYEFMYKTVRCHKRSVLDIPMNL